MNLNGPVQSSFLRQTRTSDYKNRFRIAPVLGPFLIIRASVIYRFAYNYRISFVILLIASALCMTEGDGTEFFIILGYASNINNVSTILSGPAKSLTILTAIYNAISGSILSRSSSRIILYTRRKG